MLGVSSRVESTIASECFPRMKFTSVTPSSPASWSGGTFIGPGPVSYTHLAVDTNLYSAFGKFLQFFRKIAVRESVHRDIDRALRLVDALEIDALNVFRRRKVIFCHDRACFCTVRQIGQMCYGLSLIHI